MASMMPKIEDLVGHLGGLELGMGKCVGREFKF